jgi:predicted metal-dependent hydrolase
LPSLDLGTRAIEYSVIKGDSRRYTYLRFRPDLTLEVILPRGKTVDVARLLRGRVSWVRREYYRMANTKNILTSDSVMLDGKPLRLVFRKGHAEGMTVDRQKGEVEVTGTDSRSVREHVRRLFLKETSAYVVRKVVETSPSLKVRPKRVDVREIGKWGYCTRSGRISFSWQLIALPEPLREYIVLHELSHLVHFDHSAAFRRTLKSVCPDFRQRERELDKFAPYDRLGRPA